MSYFTILAAAGATFLSGPRTTLNAEQAAELGIEVKAVNFDYEYMDAPAPIFIQVDLSRFAACEVKGVGIDVWNSSEELIFGTTITSFNGDIYPFRLERGYLNTTDMAIGCDSGPDVLDHVYLFSLGDFIQAP